MVCRIDELRNKQVVCVKDGSVLGYISDIELDVVEGRLTAIVIFGKPRLFGLFGNHDDIVIPWQDIDVIGGDTVLVSTEPAPMIKK